VNLILLGPPGAGKGTQAVRLCADLGLTHLSTGDLLRRHRAEGSELGREAAGYIAAGRLVPDEIVVAMLLDAIPDDPSRGFVLDGFPRTTRQADALADALGDTGRGLDAVLLITAPDEVIVDRICGRLTCPRGHVFHPRTSPPRVAGACDHDGEPLARRPDDTPATLRHRLDVYRRETEPLVDYYDRRGLLSRFDGSLPPDAIAVAIRAQLGAAAQSGVS
jgi:adenylate kinase